MNIFIIIFLIILAISLLLTIVKRLIVATIVGIFIVILFCISFIWTSDDLVTNLKLDKIFKDETTQKVTVIYDNYTEKRNEYDSIIDQK